MHTTPTLDARSATLRQAHPFAVLPPLAGPGQGFGRVARRYPASASLPPAVPDEPAPRLHGLRAILAQFVAERLAALSQAARRRAEQWTRRRGAERTARALRGLDAAALRDLGLHECEIGSFADEIAGEVQATRERALRQIGCRFY